MKSDLRSFLALGCAAVVLAGCSPGSGNPPDPTTPGDKLVLTTAQRQRLGIQKVEPSSYHRSIVTTGTVGFDNDRATTILAPISGPVSRLVVELGAEVKAGDALAMVASPDYATAVSAYRKAVLTENNLRRIADLDQKLFQADALARRDLEQAQTDAASATADREAALQQLRAIGVPDGPIQEIKEGKPTGAINGVIRAPLSGTVVEKLISPGQLLQAGTTPCFTVADLSRVWVMTDVFESQLADVHVGDAAEIITPASAQPVAGTVENISAILDPNTRAIAVRVVAENPGGILKKQMYVEVRIRSQRQAKGILVPAAAVLRDGENLPFVYVVRPDDEFARRHVVLGSAVGDRQEVVQGLNAGERIVGDGAVYVQFAQSQ